MAADAALPPYLAVLGSSNLSLLVNARFKLWEDCRNLESPPQRIQIFRRETEKATEREANKMNIYFPFTLPLFIYFNSAERIICSLKCCCSSFLVEYKLKVIAWVSGILLASTWQWHIINNSLNDWTYFRRKSGVVPIFNPNFWNIWLELLALGRP